VSGPWRNLDLAIVFVLYALAAGVYLWIVQGANQQGTLSGEEASVSFVDVVAINERFQYTHYSTNFGGHVFFWLASYLDPVFGIFYGRRWKALAVALLCVLAYITLRRRLGSGRIGAVTGALTVALLPGVAGFSWIAIEPGLETVVGMTGVLVASSRRRFWWTAPLLAGAAVSTYGSGLVWAGVIGLLMLVRLVRGENGDRSTLPWIALAGVGGIGIVVFPLLWWGGGVIVTGGGALGGKDPLALIWQLLGELFVQGNSYYYFSDQAALGSVVIIALGLAGLAVASFEGRAIWPWLAVAAATIAMYAVAGGVVGVRRTIALAVVLGLGSGVAVDAIAALARSFLHRRDLRAALIAAVAAAVLLPGIASAIQMEQGLATRRFEIPVDFSFPIAAGSNMPTTLAQVAGRAGAGESWLSIAREREGVRTAAMVFLLQEHGRLPEANVTGSLVEDLYRYGPRCEANCEPIAGLH
jgi:hypothetical protein